MKRALLSICTSMLFLFVANGQTSITLNIHHKLASADFAFNEGSKNNMDHDFNVSRLEYYLSGFSLIHDGGKETALDNAFHVLVNASKATAIDLGEHDVTTLEAIRFYTGVHPDYNHADPAGYPSGHPLAPVFPSMHWGWAAGYRFIAFEGFGSSSYNQLVQLHGLGDDNYFMTEVEVPLTAENGTLVINLDGDYSRTLEDISVNSGVIVHGDYGHAKKALENFRDYVFSPTQTASSTLDFSEVTDFSVFPNPSFGSATLSLSTTADLTYQVKVTNMLGQQIHFFDGVQGNANLPLECNMQGIYLVSLIKEGVPVLQHKWVVQ